MCLAYVNPPSGNTENKKRKWNKVERDEGKNAS